MQMHVIATELGSDWSGPDTGTTVSSDSNGVGLLEGPEKAIEDLARALMQEEME